MNLAQRVVELAQRLGQELAARPAQDHPGVARAWVCFGSTGSQIQLRASHNVASVTRTAAGRYRVRFATPMPDANYCWTALARSSVDTGTQRLAIVRATADAKTAQYVDVSCATGATTYADSSEINLMVYR
jgi:hypothetical protein